MLKTQAVRSRLRELNQRGQAKENSVTAVLLSDHRTLAKPAQTSTFARISVNSDRLKPRALGLGEISLSDFSRILSRRLGVVNIVLYSVILRIRRCHKPMNEYTFVIRTDKDLHDRIRKLAYLANTSRSAAIRKLLQSQQEEHQLATLIG